jgi:hemerythrin-like domain-containing protein
LLRQVKLLHCSNSRITPLKTQEMELAMNTPVAAPVDATPQAAMFDYLDSCHVDMRQNLVLLRALAQAIDEDGLTDDVRASARHLRDWFNDTARQHHMDEEKHVFPDLLAAADAGLTQQVQRLVQDHGWLEEDWLEIEPSLSAAADGYSWFDPAVLRHAVGVFEQLYLDHMTLEETLAYPEARQRISADAAQAMGVEMARRRALREAQTGARRH